MNRLRPLLRPFSRVLLVGWLALPLAGCVGDAYQGIGVGTMGSHAVREVLGPGAVKTPEGYALEIRNRWPTVVGFLEVAVPESGSATSKLQFTGRVVHWIVLQTLYAELSYEGPLPAALVDGLREPPAEGSNEFQASLVEFARSLMERNLPADWQDVASLEKDRYRGRLLAVFESAATALRGQGTLRHERFSADITSPEASLHLRYVGEGVYSLELRGDRDLWPLPVL